MAIALIDADHIIYSCGFAADKSSDEKYSSIYNVKHTILRILGELHAHKYEIYLTGNNNFRNKTATLIPYKGNRAGAKKPQFYKEMREFLVDKWKAKVINNEEADDYVSVRQHQEYKLNGDWENTILVSVDKDLNQVPGWHYNYIKKNKFFITEHQALNSLWSQVLLGDRCDNIPGLYGYGPKKVEKLFKDCKDNEDFQDAVEEAYTNYYIQNNKTLRMTLKVTPVTSTQADVSKVIKEIYDLVKMRS